MRMLLNRAGNRPMSHRESSSQSVTGSAVSGYIVSTTQGLPLPRDCILQDN